MSLYGAMSEVDNWDTSAVKDWRPTSELFTQLTEADGSFKPNESERIHIEDVLGRVVPPELITYLVNARKGGNYMGACSRLQALLVGSNDFESMAPAPIRRVAKLIVGTDSCW